MTKDGATEAIKSSVNVELRSGRLISLSNEPLPSIKHNPGERLVLIGKVDGTSYPTPQAAASFYRWTVEPPIVNLTSNDVSATGNEARILILHPNMLPPDGEFTFHLAASGVPWSRGGTAAVTSISLKVNRPPFGGSLQLEYNAPAMALVTSVRMVATSWTDDDLPLTFAFGFCVRNVPVDPLVKSCNPLLGAINTLSDLSTASTIDCYHPTTDWASHCY